MEALKKTSDSKSPAAPSANKSEPLAVGTVLLGRYLLMHLIAQGGTSYIYRARDMVAVMGRDNEQSHIAIKIVNPDASEDVSESHMLLHEALTTRHLAHPNIIKVFDYHRDGAVNFVTMELIQGESLAEYLLRTPKQRLPYAQAIAVLQPVAMALQAAHEQGVIHSDMKPSNILLTEAGDVKVIDFATARANIDKNGDLTLTHDAKFYGYTLAYASPDTIADRPASSSDDVFSLACVVYEVLSGKHPYERNPSNKIKSSFRLQKPKEVGFWQWLVLKKALSLKGKQRFQSVQRFMQLFVHARRCWAYVAVLVAVLATLVTATQWSLTQLAESRRESATLQASFLQQQQVQQQVDAIRERHPLDRLGPLAQFESLPPLLREGALGQLHDDVATPIANHVQSALGYNDEVLPNFDALRQQLKKVMVFYPYSSVLADAMEQTHIEQQQLRETFLLQARQLWEETDFSLVDAMTINNVNEKLRELENDGVSMPDNVVIERYNTALTTAIESDDYIGIHQLFQFSETAKAGDLLTSAWGGIDSGIPVAAGELVRFINEENTEGKPFPELVVTHFIDPFFSRVSKMISDARLDKDIFAAKEVLFNGAKNYQIADDFEQYKKVKTQLVRKINAKISQHNTRGNWRSARKLKALLKTVRNT